MHFLSVSHILPPSHADSIVYEHNREHAVRRDDVQFLDRLVGDGRDTSIRDIPNDLPSGRICGIVDRSKHSRYLGDHRIASASSFGIGEEPSGPCQKGDVTAFVAVEETHLTKSTS